MHFNVITFLFSTLAFRITTAYPIAGGESSVTGRDIGGHDLVLPRRVLDINGFSARFEGELLARTRELYVFFTAAESLRAGNANGCQPTHDNTSPSITFLDPNRTCREGHHQIIKTRLTEVYPQDTTPSNTIKMVVQHCQYLAPNVVQGRILVPEGLIVNILRHFGTKTETIFPEAVRVF